MNRYQIITDSACDLPKAMLQENNIKIIPLSVHFRGEAHNDSVEHDEVKTLYDAMRAGEVASTSAANPDAWASIMEPALLAGEDVLTLAFSSGLSTTYQSAVIAANELMEKYPQRKIKVVDTGCAALGQGLLVWYACKKRDEGLDLDELALWCQENKLHIAHWFTVDDLIYLKRGGRVSSATALLGAMLNIKPVLHVDDEGHLISMSKVRGRKAAIEMLAKKIGELGGGYDNSTVFISHADCLADANTLKHLVQENYGVKDVFIGNLGSVIGSHAGPGTLALFFVGEHR